MAGASTAGVHMAQKEFYPDVTVTGSVFTRPGEYQDMWSLTATFNIPLYYNARQSQALAEARAMSLSAEHDLEGVRSMVASAVRDNYAMIRSADALMNLYREGCCRRPCRISNCRWQATAAEGRGDHRAEQAEGPGRL